MVLVAGLMLALGAVALVVLPVMRGAGPTAAEALPLEADADPEAERRDLALAALKEIEFDHATGKLSDPDYESLRARYTSEALDALRAGEVAPEGDPSDPAEALIARARAALRAGRACPACGPRLESDARFCSSCGRALQVRTRTAPSS